MPSQHDITLQMYVHHAPLQPSVTGVLTTPDARLRHLLALICEHRPFSEPPPPCTALSATKASRASEISDNPDSKLSVDPACTLCNPAQIIHETTYAEA